MHHLQHQKKIYAFKIMFNYNTLQLCKKSITVIIECCIIFLYIEQGISWHHSMEKVVWIMLSFSYCNQKQLGPLSIIIIQLIVIKLLCQVSMWMWSGALVAHTTLVQEDLGSILHRPRWHFSETLISLLSDQKRTLKRFINL